MPNRRPLARATIAAAAVAMLGAPLSPQFATAATVPPPVSAASAVAGTDCVELQRRAAALLAPGQVSDVACLEKRGTQRGYVAGAGVNANCPRNSSFLTRSRACNNTDWRLNIRQVPTGTIVGWIDFSTEITTTLDYRSLQWTQQFVYTPRASAGGPAPYVTQTVVEAFPLCVSACQVASLRTFLPSPAMPPVVNSGTVTYQTSGGLGTKWNAAGGWRFRFVNTNWITPISNEEVTVPPLHRCDDMIGGRPAGCAYATAEARHDIGSLRYPKYARHIQLAISFGLPSTLTRTTNQTLIDRNRAVACGGREGTSGWSCDEYPFASTYQGAASQPYGRTFLIINWQTGATPFVCNINGHLNGVPLRQGNDHGGYSVCMVPLAENTGGGSDLGQFYYENRVIDGDNFMVRVV